MKRVRYLPMGAGNDTGPANDISSRKASVIPCPLCSSGAADRYAQDKCRTFLHCSSCGLVFVPPVHFLSPEEEKKRYDLHQNRPHDEGYLRFLERLVRPLKERIPCGSRGLDFGSGPVPVMSTIFTKAGYAMTSYDRYYARHGDVWQQEYDFIAACEVAEHLREPRQELDRLWTHLAPGGWLGIMTGFLVPPEAFSTWSYKNDMTHICFYSPPVFRWMAAQWKGELVIIEPNVALFRKQELG